MHRTHTPRSRPSGSEGLKARIGGKLLELRTLQIVSRRVKLLPFRANLGQSLRRRAPRVHRFPVVDVGDCGAPANVARFLPVAWDNAGHPICVGRGLPLAPNPPVNVVGQPDKSRIGRGGEREVLDPGAIVLAADAIASSSSARRCTQGDLDDFRAVRRQGAQGAADRRGVHPAAAGRRPPRATYCGISLRRLQKQKR
jgi:hypothetical protein